MATHTTTADADAPERKPFAAVLQEMRRGGLHTELGEELADLIVTCTETQKKGALTITLQVTPKGDDRVEIEDKIAVKAPRHNTQPSHFWTDADGNLTTQNPNQLELGALREVQGARADKDNLRQIG